MFKYLFILLSLVGCAEAADYHTVPFREVPPPFQAVTQQDLYDQCYLDAVRWEEATGVYQPCDELFLVWTDYNKPDGNELAGAWTDHDHGQIFVKKEHAWILSGILIHELGHIISGRDDHPEDGQVMYYAYVSEDVKLNDADVDYICDAKTCTRHEAELDGVDEPIHLPTAEANDNH